MGVSLVSIKVEDSDEKLLMNECKSLFLKYHPEMEGMELTRRFMFKKVVEWYLK